ncbi:putative nuclease HARBI1 [Ischnura elegans]|uniref:putative nuclease HARBI1 n=1 Tax=Ischnura elegans TaxID=197161 RepID=UPI001ED88D94|nr:putative nuclease HARBI1 [Ischnura elegans]
MHFRLKKGTVRDLIAKFQASEEYLNLHGHGGFEPVSAQKHVLAYLWFVGHEAAGYRDVADRFNVSLSTLNCIIKRINNFILGMAPILMKEPSNEEKNATKRHFLEGKGFPDVIGLIDGTHFRIDKPVEDPESYINRKKYFSIQAQAIVNEKGKFTDVFVGYPGSVHDARVFKNSSIYPELPNYCQGLGYLLGDSAYPCSQFMITPYRDNGHQTRAQRNFNFIHSSVRITVEHAFGWLKQRFRQLYHLKGRDMVELVKTIHACFILHNIADVEDLDGFDEPLLEDHPDRDAEALQNRPDEVVDNYGDPIDAEGGRILRDEICRQLAMRGANF